MRLALCVLEAARSGAAYISALRLFGETEFPAGRFGAAALFAPQLVIPVAWFLLWLDPLRNRPFLGLIATAKALSIAAGVAWIGYILSQAQTRFFIDRIGFLADLSTRGLFLIADAAFMAVAIAAAARDSASVDGNGAEERP